MKDNSIPARIYRSLIRPDKKIDYSKSARTFWIRPMNVIFVLGAFMLLLGTEKINGSLLIEIYIH